MDLKDMILVMENYKGTERNMLMTLEDYKKFVAIDDMSELADQMLLLGRTLLPLNRGKAEVSDREIKTMRWQSTDMLQNKPLMHTTGHLWKTSSVSSVRL